MGFTPAFAGVNPSYKCKKGSGRAAPLVRSVCGERLFGGFRRSIINWARHHRDELAAADPLVELHMSRFERKQRVVAAHADLVAGMELGAALAHDDVAGDDDLA